MTAGPRVIEESEISKIDVSYFTTYPDETLTVTVDDPNLIEVDMTSLSVATNLDCVGQTITVRAIENAVTEGPRTATVTVGDHSFEFTIIDQLASPQPDAVSLASIVTNDGDISRSQVSSLTATFDGQADSRGRTVWVSTAIHLRLSNCVRRMGSA